MKVKAAIPRFRASEASAIGLWALAIFLASALGTWSIGDPVWKDAFTQETVHNLMGPLGAFVGDALTSLFGCAAWLFPLVIALLGVQLMRGELQALAWADSGRITLAWSVLLIAASSLADLSRLPDDLFREGAGGIIGGGLASAVTAVVGVFGAALALLAIAGICLQWVGNFSWRHLCGVIGRILQACASSTVAQCVRIWRLAIKWLLGEAIHIAKTVKRAPEEVQVRRAPVIPGEDSSPTTPPPAAVHERPSEPAISKTGPSRNVPVQGTLIEPQRLDEMPALDKLDQVESPLGKEYDDESLRAMSALLENKLQEFGIEAGVRNIVQGPVITRYEVELAPGTKSASLRNLQRDLARAMAVQSVRVVDVIEGKTFVGVELPNPQREVIRLRTLLSSREFKKHKSPLLIALGKDTKGDTRVADIADMPHLLMAGTTGAGKSVAINALLLSILFRASPSQVRIILIDPKMVELSVYQDIPHLLTPVITEMPDTVQALRWCTEEMDRRYKLMNELGARSLSGYNERVQQLAAEELQRLDSEHTNTPLPSILLVIDEFADMMASVRKQVEEPIARLSAKARAAGIHLVLATQRPSKDVITGLIKANIATRISFQVSQKVDSMVVLDQIGAEQLLGRGDMLFRYRGQNAERLHGAFVTDEEVARVVEDWRRRGAPDYVNEVTEPPASPDEGSAPVTTDGEQQDEHYAAAVELVRDTRRASISLVQRQFRIGYNRAANIMEAMEKAGVVSPPNHDNTREVLDAPRSS